MSSVCMKIYKFKYNEKQGIFLISDSDLYFAATLTNGISYYFKWFYRI